MASITETLLTDVQHKKDFVKQDAPGGDLTTISGLENVKQAILRRIMTEPGSLTHRPNYGVGLKQFQNAPASLATHRELANRISQQLRRDSRIAEVTSVSVDVRDSEPEKARILVSVLIVGFDEIVPVVVPFGEVF